jgi:hypothetical protein
MGSLRPCTVSIVVVISVLSLLLSSFFLLRFPGGAPSTDFGKVLPVEASSTSTPFNTFETPDGVAGTVSTGIGATTPTTRYAPTDIKNTLYPGELPGYTGWPRPTSTLAGFFRIVDDSYSSSANSPYSQPVVVGKNWTCSIHCSHKACRHGGSLFFIRAYGPAILPGLYTDHRNGYMCSSTPEDDWHDASEGDARSDSKSQSNPAWWSVWSDYRNTSTYKYRSNVLHTDT